MHGIIVIWSGTVNDIPDGWVLCDGTNGTPNLKDKFVRSRGLSYEAHGHGGGRYHNHSVQIFSDTHDHQASSQSQTDELDVGDRFADIYPTGDYDHTTVGHQHDITVDPDGHAHTGLVSAGDHNPNYYTLCYIMKT